MFVKLYLECRCPCGPCHSQMGNIKTKQKTTIKSAMHRLMKHVGLLHIPIHFVSRLSFSPIVVFVHAYKHILRLGRKKPCFEIL